MAEPDRVEHVPTRLTHSDGSAAWRSARRAVWRDAAASGKPRNAAGGRSGPSSQDRAFQAWEGVGILARNPRYALRTPPTPDLKGPRSEWVNLVGICSRGCFLPSGSERTLDGLRDLLDIDRLGQVMLETRVKAPHPVISRSACRQRNHRNVLRRQ